MRWYVLALVLILAGCDRNSEPELIKVEPVNPVPTENPIPDIAIGEELPKPEDFTGYFDGGVVYLNRFVSITTEYPYTSAPSIFQEYESLDCATGWQEYKEVSDKGVVRFRESPPADLELANGFVRESRQRQCRTAGLEPAF